MQKKLYVKCTYASIRFESFDTSIFRNQNCSFLLSYNWVLVTLCLLLAVQLVSLLTDYVNELSLKVFVMFMYLVQDSCGSSLHWRRRRCISISSASTHGRTWFSLLSSPNHHLRLPIFLKASSGNVIPTIVLSFRLCFMDSGIGVGADICNKCRISYSPHLKDKRICHNVQFSDIISVIFSNQ